MKKQKNNHARKKRIIKLLKLKSFCKRVIEKRYAKAARLRKPKGKTLAPGKGRAKHHAEYVPDFRTYSRIRGHKNQRQQRKIWRNAPHMRKRA